MICGCDTPCRDTLICPTFLDTLTRPLTDDEWRRIGEEIGCDSLQPGQGRPNNIPQTLDHETGSLVLTVPVLRAIRP